MALPQTTQEWLALHSDRAVTLSALRLVSREAPCPEPTTVELQPGARVRLEGLTLNSPRYPRALRRLTSPPPLIWMLGNQKILELPAFSLCGSRHAGARGLKWASHFGRSVAERGAVLVTGLARGVDSSATEAAIGAGGRCIAVLPEGFRKWKRPDLVDAVLSGTLLLISEFKPDAPWTVGQAMQRNATICAFGSAMFVIEAGETGGTLAAGRTALRLGVPLHAIKYPDGSPGNEILIGEGAHPLTKNSELASVLGRPAPTDEGRIDDVTQMAQHHMKLYSSVFKRLAE